VFRLIKNEEHELNEDVFNIISNSKNNYLGPNITRVAWQRSPYRAR
jgi:hypothetical protein